MKQPREYQTACKNDIYRGFARGKDRGIIVAPVGSGKTFTASLIVHDYVRRLKKRVLFIVHRSPLIGQTIQTMADWGIKSGVIAGGYKESRSLLFQIASFQTLTPEGKEDKGDKQSATATRRDIDRMLRWFKPDLIIFDECHLVNFTSVALLLVPKLRDRKESRDPWKSIGLTATPYRLKEDESLGDIYQFMTCAPMPGELIDSGVLARPVYFDVPNAGLKCKIDVKIDYIIRNWLKKAQNSKTIAFCPSVAFAKSLAAAFNEIGIKAAIVHGGTSRKRREVIFDDFKSDDPDTTLVLCSCKALTEGFDATNARCGIFALDTNSLALAYQMLGRILRSHTYPDGSIKIDAIVLDCVGLWRRIPYYEDVRITPASLYESGVRVPGDAPRKICPPRFTIQPQEKISPGGEMQMVNKHAQQVAYYRRLVRTAFKTDKHPDWAVKRYYKRFRSYPLDSWRLNAIYKVPTPAQREAVKAYYRKYSFMNSDPDHWESKQLSLELGYSGDRTEEELDLSKYEAANLDLPGFADHAAAVHFKIDEDGSNVDQVVDAIRAIAGKRN